MAEGPRVDCRRLENGAALLAPKTRPMTQTLPKKETASERLGAIALFLFALLAFVAVVANLHFTVNVTPSMPIGLYRLAAMPQALSRGSIINICPTEAVAQLAAERNYMSAGSCAYGRSTLLKFAIAVPGDTVDLTDEAIVVNGTKRYAARRVTHDLMNRPLPRVPTGHYTLTDRVWLWTPYKRSWDSRYYGPLPVANVRGLATLVVRFPSMLAGRIESRPGDE